MNAETKNCQNCKADFVIDAEDFDFYTRVQVPPPTFCPDCRLKRRFIWRNERVLYRRKDDAGGKEMFAGFHADAPFPVFERDHWWSDNFDASVYERDYDFSRPFFEQFREFMNTVPEPSRSVLLLTNSDYTDQAGNLKNCYLCFNCDFVENAAYFVRGITSRDVYDALQVQNSEIIYEGVVLEKCFRTFYSVDCESSTDMWFSRDCVGCSNCFGCVGLRKKNYHIWNQPYSKEEYFKKLEELNLGSRSAVNALWNKVDDFWTRFPARYYHGIRNVGSSGDMLNDTKNTRQCWFVSEAENVRYSSSLYMKTANTYDLTVWGGGAENIYESLTCGMQINGLKFCFDCWPSCKNLEYCITCHSSSDCFACIGLKKGQYCIFNKQYSKEEYLALRAKIIEQMNAMPYLSKSLITGEPIPYRYGEFFPPEFSPFAYNESMLQDAFPLPKEAAIAAGYRWRDQDAKTYQITIRKEGLTDNIKDVDDTILKEIIECAACGAAYRIVAAELGFCRNSKLPLPDRCPECRHKRRFALINHPIFLRRSCMCSGVSDESGVYKNAVTHAHGSTHCPNDFETAYQKDSNAILYCEQCYNAEIV